jgi:hypothetical protein
MGTEQPAITLLLRSLVIQAQSCVFEQANSTGDGRRSCRFYSAMLGLIQSILAVDRFSTGGTLAEDR